MASRAHRQALALIERYLDPRRRWDGAVDRELREHLSACPPCQRRYDRAVTAHRLLVGGDPEEPTGFEQNRMIDAVVGAAAGAPPVATSRARWWIALGGALAAAAVAAVVLVPRLDSDGPVGDDATLTVKGPEHGGPLVGLGITGVSEAGGEYEVVAAEGAYLGDYLRFSYSNERPAIGYLFVVGLQGDEVRWYAPLPPDETESLPIRQGRLIPLAFETRLAARHAPGDLRVVALFTRRPIALAAMRAALDPTAMTTPAGELEMRLERRLELGPDAIIQVLDTHVVAGTEAEAPSDGP